MKNFVKTYENQSKNFRKLNDVNFKKWLEENKTILVFDNKNFNWTKNLKKIEYTKDGKNIIAFVISVYNDDFSMNFFAKKYGNMLINLSDDETELHINIANDINIPVYDRQFQKQTKLSLDAFLKQFPVVKKI